MRVGLVTQAATRLRHQQHTYSSCTTQRGLTDGGGNEWSRSTDGAHDSRGSHGFLALIPLLSWSRRTLPINPWPQPYIHAHETTARHHLEDPPYQPLATTVHPRTRHYRTAPTHTVPCSVCLVSTGTAAQHRHAHRPGEAAEAAGKGGVIVYLLRQSLRVVLGTHPDTRHITLHPLHRSLLWVLKYYRRRDYRRDRTIALDRLIGSGYATKPT